MKNKTGSNHKESTPGEIKKHEEKIAGFIGSLNDYGDPFHESAQNMAEMLGNIKNGLLSARKYGTERVEQFIKKKLLSRSNFLRFHTTQHYSDVIEEGETEKGNIRPQRRLPGS